MNKFGIWLGACNCLSNKAQASRFIFIHIEICMYTLLHNCKIIIVIVIWWLWTPNCCFFSVILVKYLANNREQRGDRLVLIIDVVCGFSCRSPAAQNRRSIIMETKSMAWAWNTIEPRFFRFNFELLPWIFLFVSNFSLSGRDINQRTKLRYLAENWRVSDGIWIDCDEMSIHTFTSWSST